MNEMATCEASERAAELGDFPACPTCGRRFAARRLVRSEHAWFVPRHRQSADLADELITTHAQRQMLWLATIAFCVIVAWCAALIIYEAVKIWSLWKRGH